MFIKKIAVLGAGVMGAQIAAHCVNAGFETLLYDLGAKDGDANALVQKSITNLSKLKPSPLGDESIASKLQAKNYEAHLSELQQCSLIIEAIAERMDWKEALYQKITPHLSSSAIVVSNTSGLSINELASVLPESQQARFCGVHFFNPPRYMHLVELIPAKNTDPKLLDELETWFTRYLGKGIVRAKDTPNFIANRIGVFSLLSILHHTNAFGLGLDEVDALTGPLIGRPKSASYRTMDVVGLDTMSHVVRTMQDQLKTDPWHALFQLPDWLLQMIDKGHLGQKSGQGLYRKKGAVIEVYDYQNDTYRPSQATVSDIVKKIMQIPDGAERMKQLLASDDKQAQFLVACFRDLFHYCAVHLNDIAHSVRDVDLAIRWGFGWRQGPFESWQMSDFALIKRMIEESGASSKAPLPAWLADISSFYTPHGAFSPSDNQYHPKSNLPVYQRQLFPETVLLEPKRMGDLVYENEGVRLTHYQDDIAVLNFKSKANSIGQVVIDGLHHAMNLVESKFQGLVIHQQDADTFSAGADLKAVLGLIAAKNYQAIDEMIEQFQQSVMRIKYSSVPVVAGFRGKALGGGCELLLHCHSAVSAFEAYPGLVELGVGVIPAGGGCKEMALRASASPDSMSTVQSYFQQIATAKVAQSALEAKQMGYLQSSDAIVMNSHEVLAVAMEQVKWLNQSNYRPLMPTLFKVAGIEGKARLQTGLVNWLEGGFISKHDYHIATELLHVLCGGDVYQGTLVSEEWMLKLEREAFIKLTQNPLTQARMQAMLETGRALRN